MVYSVYNWNTKQYDYYNGPGEANGQRPRARKGPRNGEGQQIEALLSVLPANAQPAGSGTKPRGRIAIHHSSSAVGLGATPAAESAAWSALAYSLVGVFVAYRVLTYVARSI